MASAEPALTPDPPRTLSVRARGLELRHVVAIPALVLGTALLATGLDPYLTWSSPWLAQSINAAGPVLLALLLFAVSGRWWLSLVSVSALLALVVFADATKQSILFNNLLYADFKVLPDLLGRPELVAGFIHPSKLQWTVAGLALVFLSGLAVWSFRRHAQPRALRALAGLLSVAGIVAVETYPMPVQIPSLGWLLPMQIQGASQVGVAGNILLGRMVSHDMLPEPDHQQMASFWADPNVSALRSAFAAAPAGPRPDIVIIQSESLFEPSLLCGFPDRPFLENVAAQAVGRDLQVPVFGSRTLQTEFEVLAGFPVDFAPKSMFSYYDLVDRPVNALPRQLDKLGYRTVAVHPSVRSFWRRDYAIPAMGFRTFIDGSSYFRNNDFSKAGWVNDAALTGTIISQLEAAQEPAMVFAISIANHGPWGEKPVTDAMGIELPASLTGAARNELLDYLVRARAADRAYGALLRVLAARARPTLVVFYGDHLPALTRTFGQLCFKDGKAPRLHSPPVRVWSNFPLKATLPSSIPSHWLAGWTLRAAGLPMDGQFLAAAVLAQLQLDPAVGPAEMQRLGSMYGHVAASAALDSPAEEGPLPVLVAKREAYSVMARLQEGAGGAASPGDSLQFPLQLAADHAQETSFRLSGRVSGAVLRPYLELASTECLTRREAGVADFEAWADGRRLLAERLHPNSVKLPFLDLAGVDRLTLRTRAPQGAGDCGRLAMRVGQLLCYSADCQQGPPERLPTARATAASVRPGQTLTDPLASDLGRSYYILRHLLASQAPYTPIRLTPENRLFLHPTAEAPAWIEADVSQIRLIEMVPRIEPLDQACSANPQGGIVGVTVSVDGATLARQSVDRSSKDVLSLPVDGKTLRIEVDAGNGVAWCDWFAMGFSRLVRRVPDASDRGAASTLAAIPQARRATP